jgi:hypothetical protein
MPRPYRAKRPADAARASVRPVRTYGGFSRNRPRGTRRAIVIEKSVTHRRDESSRALDHGVVAGDRNGRENVRGGVQGLGGVRGVAARALRMRERYERGRMFAIAYIDAVPIVNRVLRGDERFPDIAERKLCASDVDVDVAKSGEPPCCIGTTRTPACGACPRFGAAP